MARTKKHKATGPMRIILFTGKGGVGKTSVAAATAVRAARRGHRTVVLSTDLAHSLADSFDRPLGPEPVQVAERLWAQETDIYYNLKKYWGKVQEWINALLSWRGLDAIVADELSVLPGMEELANLLWINRHRESGEYDVVVVDCAPTGETLRLLSFPEVARWWIEKLLPIQRVAAHVVRPLVKTWTGMPMPDDEVYDAVQELMYQLGELHGMLVDPDMTTVRLVLNPEKMVIREAQRTYTYLNLFGYPCDGVVCNRVIPATVQDSYFVAWKETQGRYRRLVEEAFSPLPIFEVPLFDHEIVGIEALEELGEVLYGDRDPAEIFFRGRTHSVERVNGEYVLSLPLPFVEKGDVSLLTR
ncbi:MAG TPA: TRC40/GET3/ArsA family transport-energizing ATPase, partial [Chloroflexota bacterium]